MPDQNSQQRQDRPLVIGITGRIGAGKTSVGKYLNSAYGFYYTRYSQVLSDWFAKDDPESKAHLQVVGWKVMAGGMQAELNARLISQLPAQSDCAVDGLRHSLDYDSLKTAFSPGFYLLYVSSSPELRWRRLQSRYPDLEDFGRADSHPVEQQIDSLLDKAFAVLENHSSLQSFYSKVDAVLEKIRSGGPR
ncbi:MAG: AAA family ATPase [Terriglobales bacterium]